MLFRLIHSVLLSECAISHNCYQTVCMSVFFVFCGRLLNLECLAA